MKIGIGGLLGHMFQSDISGGEHRMEILRSVANAYKLEPLQCSPRAVN